MATLPRTSSGKFDLRALQEREAGSGRREATV
jgi:acyl-CoA synthetase (AMP-forming)/AMP-acid ligase II